jgi:predicted O-methyltransferase YrrM
MSNCCEQNAFLRASGADGAAFSAAFRDHELRLLYPIFRNYTPKYVLHAGAGAGFSTLLLKLVLPNSVLVAVEPAPAEHEAMAINVRE